MSIEERTERIMNQVPDYYGTSAVFQAIVKEAATELGAAEDDQTDLIKQLYVPTATWGLKYWEEAYAIIPKIGDSYEIRRARILSKIASPTTFNPAAAEVLANFYSKAQTAKYADIPGTYTFHTIHEIDELVDYDGLVETFEEMKFAHLKHIVYLIIRLAGGPDFKTSAVISCKEVYSPAVNYNTRGVIKIKAFFLGVGDFPNLEDYSTLYMNGAWLLDGTYLLNGVNPQGKNMYVQNADRLRILRKVNGSLIEDIIV